MAGNPAVRWLPVVNTTNETIPPFSVMQCVFENGMSEQGRLKIGKPTGSFRAGDILFNSSVAIPAGKDGEGTHTYPVRGSYSPDLTDNTADPQAGELWGPLANDWRLYRGLPGFITLGGAVDGVANFVPEQPADQPPVVRVRNDTGVALVHCAVVGLGDWVIRPPESPGHLLRRPLLKARLPIVVEYVQVTDPGAVGAGKYWVDYSNQPKFALYQRNVGNTGWDTIATDWTWTYGDEARFGVLIGALATGKEGTAIVSGSAPVRIKVASLEHKFLRPISGDVTQVITADTGPLIIRRDSPHNQRVTGAVNNGSGLIRLSVYNTATLTTGQTVRVYGVAGVPANGDWVITVISGSQIDLVGSTFSGSYTTSYGQALLVKSTITGVASGGGLVRVTSPNHNLVSGDNVDITGSTGADGDWVVRKIDNNTIELIDSIYTVGGSGGSVRKIIWGTVLLGAGAGAAEGGLTANVIAQEAIGCTGVGLSVTNRILGFTRGSLKSIT